MPVGELIEPNVAEAPHKHTATNNGGKISIPHFHWVSSSIIHNVLTGDGNLPDKPTIYYTTTQHHARGITARTETQSIQHTKADSCYVASTRLCLKSQ